MSRRVSLPGADELFRATATATAAAPAGAAATPDDDAAVASKPRDRARRPRHEEKITVYVSASDLIELERCRLTLRANHGLGVDRGRIVREALAVVLADFESKGPDSILVRRLRD